MLTVGNCQTLIYYIFWALSGKCVDVNKLSAVFVAVICQLSEMLCSLCRDHESNIEEMSTADVVSLCIALIVSLQYHHLCLATYVCDSCLNWSLYNSIICAYSVNLSCEHMLSRVTAALETQSPVEQFKLNNVREDESYTEVVWTENSISVLISWEKPYKSAWMSWN